jgi:DNA polymerase-4
VRVVPGVGPVTAEKLRRLGVTMVADLRAVSVDELSQVIGRAQARGLVDLAHARDDRPVIAERETKSISVEDTFETDLVDSATLLDILDRDARSVAARLRAAALFARTVTIKVRLQDFSTHTRSRSLLSATNDADVIADIARSLLSTVNVTGGVRLLGAGVAGLTDVLQEGLFDVEPALPDQDGPVAPATAAVRQRTGWPPGADVRHERHGDGWVWGSGLGRVTVRFETRDTPPGPVRTFDADDPALQLI